MKWKLNLKLKPDQPKVFLILAIGKIKKGKI